MDLSYSIMHEYYSSDKTIANLKLISEKFYAVYKNENVSANLDIMIGTIENGKSAVYQISPYNNFEIIKSSVNSGEIGIFSGGIKTEDCLIYLQNEIGKHKRVEDIFIRVFENLSCEQIGGKLIAYEISDKSGIKQTYNEKINEKELRCYNSYHPDKNLVIAEMVLGKLILGQKVTIGDADGVWLTEGPTTTIYDRFEREAMKFGLYETSPDKFGMVVNRYDSASTDETILNKIIIDSESGFKITQWTGSEFKDKFYADNDGLLYAEDMTTKRLKIVSDTDELLLDSFTKYMDIGKFDNIITDGKLTAIEKLQVKGERERIVSEYAKLLAQANIYKTSSRDSTILIDTTNFTAVYNALLTYVDPLLVDMDATSNINRTEFIGKFKDYYDETVNIINKINDSIKYSSVQLGSLYNNFIIDAASGAVATRSDKLYRASMSGTNGFLIERNIDTPPAENWEKVFWADLDGIVHAQGIQIESSFITDGVIVGATLKIGSGDHVFKADTNGIYLGNDVFANAPFSVDLDGNVKAHKLKLYGKAGELFIDTDAGVMDMNSMDIIGVGLIQSSALIINTLVAGEAVINDLTVNHLRTLNKLYTVGQYADYIDIQDNFQKFITASVSARNQAKDEQDRNLYWTDSTMSAPTIEITSYPIYEYTFDSNDFKEKRVDTFIGSGAAALPISYWGTGDGFVTIPIDGVDYHSGQATLFKDNGYFTIRYMSSNSGKEKSIMLGDSKVEFVSQETDMNFFAHNFNFQIEANGTLVVEHEDGAKLEFASNGHAITLSLNNGSTFKLSETDGLKADITGAVDISSTGNMSFSAPRIDFN